VKKSKQEADLVPTGKVTWPKIKKLLLASREDKYKDTSASYTVVDYAGVVIDLLDIAQGNTDTTRIGDTIIPTRIEIRGQVHANDTTQAMRVLLLRWREDANEGGSTPALAQFLQPTFVSTTQVCYAPFYHDKREMFDVLFDKTFAMCGSTSSPNYVEGFQFIRNLPPVPVQYTNNGGSPYLGINKLYLAFVSDSSTANHPAYTHVTRVHYNDA